MEEDFATGFYRLDYKSRDYLTDLTTSFYVEHKDIMGLKVRATAQNLFNQKENGFQTFYVDRRDGPVSSTRDATYQWGMMHRLTVWDTF